MLFEEECPGGRRLRGTTAAVEAGDAWVVTYEIEVDATWRTRWARLTGESAAGSASVVVSADGAGHWEVDGASRPDLDGCLDVDLESSACTNALPVRRLGLEEGGRADAPAAYVRALDLRVERLEQSYLRLPQDGGTGPRYDYAAPAFGFDCELRYDAAGLVVDYPGIAVRVH